MKGRKWFAMMLAPMFAISLIGCGVEDRGPADEIDASYQWATAGNFDGTQVLDSSEIADYSGSHEIKLTAWNTDGTGNFKTYSSSNDVVTTEIQRITGVSIDAKKSFDNKGSTAENRYNNLITNGQIPDIAYGTGWIDTEDVWDLTELVDEYCPTIKARMPSYVWNNENVTGGEKGKIYGIPYGLCRIFLWRRGAPGWGRPYCGPSRIADILRQS